MNAIYSHHFVRLVGVLAAGEDWLGSVVVVVLVSGRRV